MSGSLASAKTHTGNVRQGNEDAFFSDDALGLWLVADGMGGHEAGEVASAIASKTVAEEIRSGKTLAEAIQSAHHAILQGAQDGEGAHGMGSTIVAIHQVADNSWELGWVGDSRAYLWSQDSEGGQLQQISRDHSYVQALLDSGAITQVDAENHPEKNVITQCLGSVELSNVRVDTVTMEWKAGQKILMCSDGLSDEVSDEEIASILANNNDSKVAVEKLIEAALKNGGKDNITAVLVDAPKTGSAINRTFDITKIILIAIATACVIGVTYSLFWRK